MPATRPALWHTSGGALASEHLRSAIPNRP